MWLRDYHVDGLRLDAVHALHDPRAMHLLEQLAGRGRGAVDAPRPAAVADRRVRPQRPPDGHRPRGGGYGLHAQWCDDIHHCLHAALTGGGPGLLRRLRAAGLTWLAHVLTGRSSTRAPGPASAAATTGAPVDTRRIPGHRFVAYLQNHDQIGNRATGDRLRRPSRRACSPAARRCCSARRSPRCCSWARSGRRHPLAVLLPLPRRRSRRRARGRRTRVRRARLGAAEDSGPERRADLPPTPGWTGPSRPRSRTRRC